MKRCGGGGIGATVGGGGGENAAWILILQETVGEREREEGERERAGGEVVGGNTSRVRVENFVHLSFHLFYCYLGIFS